MRKFVFRFTQKWWSTNFGFKFNHRYYTDPIWRVARHQEMQDIIQGILYDVPTRCFALSQGNVGLILEPINIIMGICGSDIEYPENQDPWAVGPILQTVEEIESFEAPNLENSSFLEEQVAQFKLLAQAYPLSGIEAFGTGNSATFNSTLVCAHKLVGEELFILMHQRPELVHNLLTKLTELNVAIIDFWAHLRCVVIKDLFIGDCSASLLSPNLYHEFSLPYNAQIIERYGATYGIHSCGPSTHIVQDLVVEPGVNWCEVGWYAVSGHTNLIKAHDALIEAGCPQIRVLLNAGDILQWDQEDIKQYINNIIRATKPLDLVVRSILEEGVSLENVRTLYHMVEEG
jgi:uroporphyrinogen-III decarboxylase